MKDRLIRLLDSEQLSASKFADRIGVQRSSVSHVLSGRNKPSFDFVKKTLLAFPGLNADWLILGKGEMITGIPDYTGATLFDSPVSKDKDTTIEGISDIPFDEEAVPDTVKNLAGTVDTEKIVINSGSKKVIKVMLLYDDQTFNSFDPGN